MNVATAPSMQSLGIPNWAVSEMSSRLPGEEFTAAGRVDHCVKAHRSHVQGLATRYADAWRISTSTPLARSVGGKRSAGSQRVRATSERTRVASVPLARYREDDDEATPLAGPIAHHLDLASVQFREPTHKRQAHAEAADPRRVGVPELTKHLEDRAEGPCGMPMPLSRTVIRTWASGCSTVSQICPSGGRVLGGVPQQVAQDLREAIRVPLHDQRVPRALDE